MSKNKIKPVGRKKDIVIQELNNEILIYDLTTHKAFSLNETSAIVWQSCDGNRTVSEISDQISRKLKSPVTEDFVWLALEQLYKENLIESEIEMTFPFEHITRRDVIQKIGLASLIALPFVSSLIAPTAANAASAAACTQTNSTCTGTTRAQGCICSPSSNAGTTSVNDGGTSNCASGLKCYRVPSGATFVSACCP